MSDSREAAAVKRKEGFKWFGCLLKLVGLLLFGAFCIFVGYWSGHISSYAKADNEYAPVWAIAFYDPDTRRTLLEESSYDPRIKEALDELTDRHGEAQSFRITEIIPGPAKTFINLLVVRDGKAFDEQILLIGRQFADFTSEPAPTSGD